ncbi:uncharacterized protein LOC122382504 [Amphibalanus amphitrite]|uniref:uncharacterized protein LOC122382504 n=1 Tax=Amphibalanus amphitrite TaxID=1232801 RepID=UPI001C9012B3|nr:uncharacterized protein LOC122382504 [Amphibalanus amphitrite]XP_043223842.1 uncharacterized protein LOC122382504 [Amphibalanus amphitrite]
MEKTGRQRKCALCGSHHPSLASLKAHLKTKHDGAKAFSCDKCTYRGVSRDALNTHRWKHHQFCERSYERSKCLESTLVAGVETACTAAVPNSSRLRTHLASEHGISDALSSETVRLDAPEDFLSWKKMYEAKTSSSYVGRCKTPTADHPAVLFKCFRSGFHKPSGKGLRRLKSQGSCKMGRDCTSEIRARLEEDGSIRATVFHFHYGHGTGSDGAAHLRIPKEDKALIKEKLLKGVGATRIISDVRRSLEACGDPRSSRTYWVNKKDVFNIAASVGLNASGAHPGSATETTSVETYAEKIRASEQQHLLALKMPGEADPDGRLGREDFIFSFCTEFQLRNFIKHGCGTVCIDETRGTSEHGFNLVTLLVLTDQGQGLPVAWLLSSREDEEAVAKMLQGLIRLCAETGREFPHAEYLMTGKTQTLFNAWIATTGQDTQHRLRLWQVNKAWRDRLVTLSQSFTDSGETSSGLRHQPSNQSRCIGALLEFADEQLLKAGRRQLWQQPGFNQVKMRRRHNAAVRLSAETGATVFRINDNLLPAWVVRSKPDDPYGEPHTVELVDQTCPLSTQCRQRCEACNICGHMMRCDCREWLGQKQICEHAHLVGLQDKFVTVHLLPAGEQSPQTDWGDDAADSPPTEQSLPPPSAGSSVGDASPAYLVAKAKEFAELMPTLPLTIREQIAHHFRQLDELVSLGAIHQAGALAVEEDRRAWSARTERQPSDRAVGVADTAAYLGRGAAARTSAERTGNERRREADIFPPDHDYL